jgi:hypothetical protein
MRSLFEIFRIAQADDFTKENAAALVKEQAEEMVQVLGYDEAEARKIMLTNIGYFAGYYPPEVADRVYEMFGTEHPVFGRAHPTPEEAFAMGMRMGRSRKEQAQKEND